MNLVEPKADCCHKNQIDNVNPNAEFDKTGSRLMMIPGSLWSSNVCPRMKMACMGHHVALTYDDGSKSFGKYREPIYLSCNETAKMWQSAYNKKTVTSFYCYDEGR